MINRILAGLLAACAVVGYAASIDANQATQAELESVEGIGPALCEAILDERRNGAYKDWQDLIGRIKGIGGHNAAKFSAAGLTINGASYRGVAPAAKKDVATRPPVAKPIDARASGAAWK